MFIVTEYAALNNPTNRRDSATFVFHPCGPHVQISEGVGYRR